MTEQPDNKEATVAALKRLKAHREGYGADLPRTVSELSEEVRILSTIISHTLSPHHPFICGASSEDADGMPKFLTVCRAVGSDWVEIYTRKPRPDTALADKVKEFFDWLDKTDETESGREFNPISIGCYRAAWTEPFGEVLEDMKKLSNYQKEITDGS